MSFRPPALKVAQLWYVGLQSVVCPGDQHTCLPSRTWLDDDSAATRGYSSADGRQAHERFPNVVSMFLSALLVSTGRDAPNRPASSEIDDFG